jgi:hypothetical protein
MPSPKKKPAIGTKFLGPPVVGSREEPAARKATATAKKRPVASHKETAPKPAEGGKMQTIYLRDGDLQKVWNAEGELKRSRVVPGRIGLSLLVRIGLDMLDEALADDRDAVLARAARVAAGDEA